MVHTRRLQSRFATWLGDGGESAADRAISNPASRGAGFDMIGFGGGQPATESYPLEALQRAYSRAILEDGPRVLPYGPSEGLAALRQIVAERLAKRGIAIQADNVAILTGSLQGLHLVGRVTLDAGDTIVTEAPTFMGALATWEHQQPTYMTIPVDDHGMLVDALEHSLKHAEVKPRFIYLLPTFQNPSGVSMTLNRRQKLLELAHEHDLLIIEDDPYGEFWFDEGTSPVPPLRSLPGAEDRVVYLGTFSKILAPGIRLAYVVAPPQLLQVLMRAKRGVDFHTDTLLQQAVVHLVRDADFDFEAHVASARRLYKARRDAMLDSLESTFGGGSAQVKWTRPGGGFFLWLDLPEHVSGQAVVEAAESEGVAVYPGWIFYPNHDGGTNGLRLSYSNATPERIHEGVARLQRAIAAVS
ncbi:MAG TPA: PLP-dependent aminotransferase family protein [Chloroflexota bacterium]|nr:PLP-dependent aminotransferase family protein [Chloroflexota bacterium]